MSHCKETSGPRNACGTDEGRHATPTFPHYHHPPTPHPPSPCLTHSLAIHGMPPPPATHPLIISPHPLSGLLMAAEAAWPWLAVGHLASQAYSAAVDDVEDKSISSIQVDSRRHSAMRVAFTSCVVRVRCPAARDTTNDKRILYCFQRPFTVGLGTGRRLQRSVPQHKICRAGSFSSSSIGL
ncbi:unnamed protein product [Arctogadus glacialis]